jgi:O-antigen ligase
VLGALVSFELSFVLFLFAGAMKANPSLAWMPVDMTGLFFALSVIGAAFIVFTKKVNRDGLVIAAAMGAFVTWLIASLAWTPGVVYAGEKALESLLVFWACAGAAVIIAADRARVRRFLTLILLIAVWFAVEAAIFYATADKQWFLRLAGTTYNQLGNTLVYGAVIATATLISVRGLGPFKWVMAALLPLFFFVLLIAGSRQSLLGLMGVLLLAAVMGFRAVPGIAFNRFQLTVWGLLLAAMVATVVAALSGESFTLRRAGLLLNLEGPGESIAGRLVLMSEAVDFWATAPVLGHGVGSFPILGGGADVRSHPHNIVLEILCELGLLGLVLFGAFLVFALRHVKLHRLREDPLFRCVFLLAVFAFARAMVGPDLTENRMLYPFLGLLALPMLAPTARGGGPLGARRSSEGQFRGQRYSRPDRQIGSRRRAPYAARDGD